MNMNRRGKVIHGALMAAVIGVIAGCNSDASDYMGTYKVTKKHSTGDDSMITVIGPDYMKRALKSGDRNRVDADFEVVRENGEEYFKIIASITNNAGEKETHSTRYRITSPERMVLRPNEDTDIGMQEVVRVGSVDEFDAIAREFIADSNR